MARVGRIAGAILAETRGRYYLVGNTKEPCSWASHGLEPPADVDALRHPFQLLEATRRADLGATCLVLELEGEELAQRLADCFVIRRTGSVSERLWRLVTGAAEGNDEPPPGTIEARWLGEMPFDVWRIVQNSVLRCM